MASGRPATAYVFRTTSARAYAFLSQSVGAYSSRRRMLRYISFRYELRQMVPERRLPRHMPPGRILPVHFASWMLRIKACLLMAAYTFWATLVKAHTAPIARQSVVCVLDGDGHRISLPGDGCRGKWRPNDVCQCIFFRKMSVTASCCRDEACQGKWAHPARHTP